MIGRHVPDEYVVNKTVGRVRELDLDLNCRHVITEAATGPYALTAVTAALAGAEVVAVAKDTQYGSMAQIRREMEGWASAVGVVDRITITEELCDKQIAKADIVTNSGHLRPLNADFIEKMKPGAVIPLMYEAWELRASDVDTDACRRHGIQVAGTNERHASVAVFDYLGLVVLKAAFETGFAVACDRCLVISDNDFGGYVANTLRANGAFVQLVSPREFPNDSLWDIVVIAATPPASGGRIVQLEGVAAALYCQLWGDVDRAGTTGRWQPTAEPAPGRMGFTLDFLGAAPVLKLQTAGLKCGQVMLDGGRSCFSDILQWLDGFPC